MFSETISIASYKLIVGACSYSKATMTYRSLFSLPKFKKGQLSNKTIISFILKVGDIILCLTIYVIYMAPQRNLTNNYSLSCCYIFLFIFYFAAVLISLFST